MIDIVCGWLIFFGGWFIFFHTFYDIQVPAGKMLVVHPRSSRFLKKGYAVTEGSKYVNPLLYKSVIIDTGVRTSILMLNEMKEQYQLLIDLEVVLQYRITFHENCPMKRYEEYAGEKRNDIQKAVETSVEHQTRQEISGLHLLEINSDRNKVAEKIKAAINNVISSEGIEVVSFTIRDLRDHHGFLRAFGGIRTWEIKRMAIIGEMENQQECADLQKIMKIFEDELKEIDMEGIQCKNQLIQLGKKFGIPYEEIMNKGFIETLSEIELIEKSMKGGM